MSVFNTLDPCALDDNADLDTRGAFNELGPLPQDVGAKDVVTRDALETMAPFFFTSDDIKVLLLLGKSSMNMDNPLG